METYGEGCDRCGDPTPGEIVVSEDGSLCDECFELQKAELANDLRTVNRMTVREFREQGYLQELNRCFLHPLGLALEVVVYEDGYERLGGIWDYRDDPEGLRYEDVELAENARRVSEEWYGRLIPRMNALGYMVQPPTDS